ncbi:adenylate cyclase [Ensifer sp. BR816]|uniref:adenylate cyclase n=1 Tax=Rhizobium sp. (strain BR816) TaxID=1057002 RepID=UPI00035F5E05|nr:adenylate cyclase [Ensifer sp. BR816]
MIHAAESEAEKPQSTDARCLAQLSRIRQSAEFDATDREHRFLQYVVEETLAGRGGRIKAYSVAVEVFGRDSTFDPQNDPIVRIAASHLRRSLERYYLTAGKSDPVVIGIPKGGYVPTFSERGSPEDADATDSATPPMQAPAPGRRNASAASALPPPGPDDVRVQLERIVSSKEFHGGGRGAALLRYIVEETLVGRAERIKGYSIAIEVFKRDESFTQDDPVVRIEAARLRRALERYYLVAGQNDPLRIEVPKGGYGPTFRWNNPVPAEPDRAAAPDSSEPATRRRRRYGALLVAGVLAVATAILGYSTIGRPGSPSALRVDTVRVPDGPTLVIAPFANLGEGPNAELYTDGVTEELLTALPRFKEIKVFGRETSKSLPPDVDVSQVRDELGARYLLAGGVRTSGSRIRVTARLLDASDGAILWSEDYDNDLRSRDLVAIQSDVASKVATAVAQPYGIIAQADAANPPPDDLGAYRCTLRFYDYRAELSVERHAEVRACLESAVARYPTYATAWAMLSIVYLDEERFSFNPKSGAPTAMERALRAARRGIQLDPGNTRGRQALMTALFFNGQYTEAMRTGEQALVMNPNDTELLGEFATRLAMGGQWHRGAELLDRAIALNPGGGGYYHGTRALAAYMLGDYPAAAAGIKQADLQKFPLFHAVAAVIYAEAGMPAEARRAGETFMRMRPDFILNIQAELTTRNYTPKDQLRLVSGLRKAGLPIPGGVEAAIARAAAADARPH